MKRLIYLSVLFLFSVCLIHKSFSEEKPISKNKYSFSKKEKLLHNFISNNMLSNSGKYYYQGNNDRERCFYINNEKQDIILAWIFKYKISDNGNNIVYRGLDNSSHKILLNGNYYENKYKTIDDAVLLMSSTGDNCVWLNFDGGLYYVINNGIEMGGGYEYVNDIQFSPDGKKITYFAKENGEWNLYDNYKKIPLNDVKIDVDDDSVDNDIIKYSPDSKRYAFVATDKKDSFKYYLYVNGIKEKVLELSRTFCFSKNNVLYYKMNHTIYCDNKVIKNDFFIPGELEFNLSGTECIYKGMENESYFIAKDGKKISNNYKNIEDYILLENGSFALTAYDKGIYSIYYDDRIIFTANNMTRIYKDKDNNIYFNYKNVYKNGNEINGISEMETLSSAYEKEITIKKYKNIEENVYYLEVNDYILLKAENFYNIKIDDYNKNIYTICRQNGKLYFIEYKYNE